MTWILPGTVLEIRSEEAVHLDTAFRSMFLGGDIALSQVSCITGLEPYTIQNWVKRGYLPPPVRKRYSQRQLCRILIINMLRSALPLEKICGLLQYINGHLDDEADDLIDDTQLYFLFVRLASRHRQMKDSVGREDFLRQIMEDYNDPQPDAKERVENVLRIMLTAWAASQLRQSAERLVAKLYETEGDTEYGK